VLDDRRVIVKIPNAGHLIGLEQPDAYVEAVVRWAKRD